MCVVALGAALAPAATGTLVKAAIGSFALASTSASIYSAYTSTAAARGQAEYQRDVAENNRQMALYAAEDAERRGGEAREAQAREQAALRGRQTAALAARGLDLGSGSTLDLLDATDYFGGVDQARIRGNTQREAWGFGVEAQNYGSAADMYGATARQQRPGVAAGIALLNGAGTVADKWVTGQQWRKPPGGPSLPSDRTSAVRDITVYG